MRRAKIAYISPQNFLDCFECVETGFPHLREPNSCNLLRRVRLVGVPEGTQVSEVWYDPSRAAFGLWLLHESWPEVRFGNVPETLSITLQTFYCDENGHTIKVETTDA
jgi:hypothetical protein